MSIKAIEETSSQLDAYEYGGKITKGKPNDSESGGAEDLTHFRFNPVSEAPAKLATAWLTAYGDQPTEILIYLVGDNAGDAFSAWLEDYDENKLIRRCDGKTQVRRYTGNGYDNRPAACVKGAGGCQCERIGRLHFTLPKLETYSGLVYRYMLTTHSWNDIKHINAVLKMLQTRYVSRGFLLNTIPLILTREPDSIQIPDGKGGYTSETRNMVKIKIAESFVRVAGAAITDSITLYEVAPDLQAPVDHIGDYAAGDSRGSYLPYLDNIFRRHFMGQTPADFFNHYGMSADEFMATYPYLSNVKTMVAQWAAATRTPVLLDSVQIRPRNNRNGGDKFKYIFDLDFVVITMYTRQAFREAGYITAEDDWQKSGTESIDPSLLATIETSGKSGFTLGRVAFVKEQHRLTA